MTDWRLGVCKVDGCGWVHAELETDEWASLRVTEAMVEHSGETGHPCREQTYYGDLQLTHERWLAERGQG